MKVALFSGASGRPIGRRDVCRTLEVLVAFSAAAARENFYFLSFGKQLNGLSGFFVGNDRANRELDDLVLAVLAVEASLGPSWAGLRCKVGGRAVLGKNLIGASGYDISIAAASSFAAG